MKATLTTGARDTILFVVGLAGIIFVTVTEGGDRPTLLVLFGAMIGLPAFLRSDAALNAAAPPAPAQDPEVKP